MKLPPVRIFHRTLAHKQGVHTSRLRKEGIFVQQRAPLERTPPLTSLPQSPIARPSQPLEQWLRTPFDQHMLKKALALNPATPTADTVLVSGLMTLRATFGDFSATLGLVRQYRGPVEKFAPMIAERQSWLQAALQGTFSGAQANHWLAEDALRTQWDRSQADGWQLEFVHARQWGEPAGALGHLDLERKRVRLRMSLQAEHPALVFAHEVEHLAQLHLIDANRTRIENRIRQMIVDSRATLGEVHDTVGNGGLAAAMHGQAMRDIPDNVVQRVLHFLMERDVTIREVDRYARRVSTQPEMRLQMFDYMAMYPRQAYAIITKQYQDSLGLSDEAVAIFDGITLDDVMFRAQCMRAADIERMTRAHTSVEVPWTSAQEAQNAIPQTVHVSVFDQVARHAHKPFATVAARLSPSDASELANFLTLPILRHPSDHIYRATSSLFPYPLQTPGSAAEHAIGLLGEYNARHSTAVGVDEILHLVQSRLPDVAAIEPTGHFFAYVTGALRISNAPQAVRQFIPALYASAAFYDFKRNPNAANYLFDLMTDTARNPAIELPDARELDALLTEWSLHWVRSAQAHTNYMTTNSYLWASRVAQIGEQYFPMATQRAETDEERQLAETLSKKYQALHHEYWERARGRTP